MDDLLMRIKPKLKCNSHNKENLQDATELMSNQLRSCELELLQAKSFILKLESDTQSLGYHLEASMKKKNRRTAQEIDKVFECPYEKCQKRYGSEVSLNLHIKIKHNGGNKTERDRLAVNYHNLSSKKEIVLASTTGGVLPEIHLNLPPGFLKSLVPKQ